MQAILATEHIEKLQQQSDMASRFAGEPTWLQNLRQAGWELFQALGHPTRKSPTWRHVQMPAVFFESAAFPQNLAAQFAAHAVTDAPSDLADVDPIYNAIRPNGQDEIRLTFVNGQFSAQHSTICAEHAIHGITIRPFSQMNFAQCDTSAFWRLSDLLPFAQQLPGSQPAAPNAMLALNTALFTDGIFIDIADHVVVQKPIRIIQIMTNAPRSQPQFLRHHLRLGQSAKARLYCDYLGSGPQEYLQNEFMQMTLAAGAQLDCYCHQQGAMLFRRWATQIVHQAANSQFNVYQWRESGYACNRDEWHIFLNDQHACTKYVSGSQSASGEMMDQQIVIHHRAHHTESQQYCRGLIGDGSHAAFGVKTLIYPKVRDVVASQTNQQLLLGLQANVNVQPLFEIHSEAVQCKHAATIGHLDDDAIFYLQARGMEKQFAINLLRQAFLNAVLEKIQDPIMRELWGKGEIL